MIIMVALLAIVWHRSFAATTFATAVNQTTAANQTTAVNQTTTVNQTTMTNETDIFCPQVIHLQKNASKGNWGAQTKAGTWKSYGMSFATKITEYVGAQWTGEEVGQVTCIYNSEQKYKMEGSDHDSISKEINEYIKNKK